MRTLFVALALTLVADPISWGPAANGLRLGVGVGAASDADKLVLAFQNSGAKDQDVLLGGNTGIGPMYAMQFTATDPNGNQCHVGYFGGANFVAGVLEPLLVRLYAGETHNLLLPLNKFVSVLNRKDVTLDALLRRGYSIRVSLEVGAESAKWSRSAAGWRGPMRVWIGKSESGDFRLTRR